MFRKLVNPLLWGNSIALSWMWGLGLFFSVQITYHFGLFGLLSFAIPNALGLVIFGMILQKVADRKDSPESLADFYAQWSKPFRLVLFLYQVLAITLTIFAVIRYLWQPLGLGNFFPFFLSLPLTVLVILATASIFGEEFDITHIKYSHAVLLCILAVAVSFLISRVDFQIIGESEWFAPAKHLFESKYWGYEIPICIGLLLGPWLDLQQWQRAIEIRRERSSILIAYLVGAALFFSLLLFHGVLTQWVKSIVTGETLATLVNENYGREYGQQLIAKFIFENEMLRSFAFPFYCTFISICILTTLDSGYIATRWFLSSNVKKSKHIIFSILPERLVTSPIPTLIFCGGFTILATVVNLELEYFMLFYATFFVGYSALGITRCFSSNPSVPLPQVKLFCVGSFSVVVFSYGYFQSQAITQIIASLIPLAYVLWLLLKPGEDEELDLPHVIKSEAASIISHVKKTASAVSSGQLGQEVKVIEVPAAQHQNGFVDDQNWFNYSLTATYSDTNSVGNVYFAMYPMWVGKTRELFFNLVLPDFDLKHTEFYILTRSFEHKFVRESKEFDEITVKIKVGDTNRKFTTLDHRIYDMNNELLGKGSQSLMFVSSSDYKLIDIPQSVYSAFMKYM
ncbi:MAG: thioesterase family protein [Verrucomicrobiota bacterium]